ncbi:RNA polymerase sigma factor [Porticoccaceae bacterium LTM1]|nr:RNA polymerase sigma factor [Porticoccaceae bacterium LTM1]
MVHKSDNVINLSSRQKQGRQQLVKQLFDEYAPMIRRFYLARLMPEDEVDDLVQELFSRLIALDGLEMKMSPETGSNLSFFLTMANNMVVDLQRKAMTRKDYVVREKNSEAERVNEQTPEVIVSALRDLEAMKSVILRMRPAWRKAFILSRFNNMSYQDIAEYMDVTLKQVEHFISQAMAKIRKAERKLREKESDYE